MKYLAEYTGGLIYIDLATIILLMISLLIVGITYIKKYKISYNRQTLITCIFVWFLCKLISKISTIYGMMEVLYRFNK